MNELTLSAQDIAVLQKLIGEIPFRLAAPIVALMQQAEARRSEAPVTTDEERSAD